MRTKSFLLAVIVVFSAVGVGGAAQAQIFLSAASNQYSQNFNSLAPADLSISSSSYTDNSTITGLYALIGSGPVGTNAATSTPTTFGYQDGSVPLSGIASFGTGPDRAFGAVVTDTTPGVGGFITYGFRFVNNDSTRNITQFSLSYQGEQWRRNAPNPQTVSFSYAVFDSGTGKLDPLTGYNPDTALDFTSPGGTTRSGLSFFETKSDTITATVRPNQELWIRWVDSNDPGVSDHNNGIDDLKLTATFDPTPAPPGFITAGIGSAVGLVHFGGAGRRKRRRHKQA